MKTGACVVTLNGHKGAVTALAFEAEGGLLASGSHDTDVIVWDLAAEAGLFRFIFLCASRRSLPCIGTDLCSLFKRQFAWT